MDRPAVTLRRVVYISGTRADFGLMRRTLTNLAAQSCIDLQIVVTGMHLDQCFGNTVDEIYSEKLKIAAKVAVPMLPSTGVTMARGIATMIGSFTDIFSELDPQAVLLLGDRGEMLAGAVSAAHLNIPIFHLHGGERSGTIDESVRHAISKFAHVHLVATTSAKMRLVAMGENASEIHIVGAPGLDEVVDHVEVDRSTVYARYGFSLSRPLALMIFHPVLQESDSIGQQTQSLLAALQEFNFQILCLSPNSDAGSNQVSEAMDEMLGYKGFHLVRHLPRKEFLDAMAICDVMVGNSSSGIIEAASFGTPVVDVGTRQKFRERGANVFTATGDKASISDALGHALQRGRQITVNPYGDGNTAPRVASILSSHPLAPSLLSKSNAY